MSSQKQEILFSRFGINYNDLSRQFRKGSIIVREKVARCHFILSSAEPQQLPIVETDDDEGESEIKIKADSILVRPSCTFINPIPQGFTRMRTTLCLMSTMQEYPRRRPRNDERVPSKDYFIMTLSGMGSGRGGRIC